ncbi:MAG: choice-of-anchor B family protein [Balneolaceae bacterium]|nr:choice-of-anchor B family protein [Balneolaceae bacterium]MDR9409923.1 choice-of-anchor B family protein [Balneolaceae bacterium]
MKHLIVVTLTFILSLNSFIALGQTSPFGETLSVMGFARAVDVADGNVFIGEPANAHQPGMVYIYRKSDEDWLQHTQLQARDGKIGDGFGTSLAASTNQLLIGAPLRNDGHGVSYVFERFDNSWAQSARIALPDSIKGGFGSSVAMQGDFIFIGAPNEGSGVGAVYVFQKDGSSWSQQTRLANPDSTIINFGTSLAVDNNRLFIGASRGDGGAVYVFSGDNSGNWTQNSTLTSDRVDNGGQFGSTIEVKDNRVLIGAPGNSGGSGSVFIFQYDSYTDSWKPGGQLVAFDSSSRYNFGSSIAFDNENAWVGAPGADQGLGGLYEFIWNTESQTWTGVRKLGGPDRMQGDNFAETLAIDGDVAVSGLTGADFGAGTAAIMERENNNWSVSKIVFSSSISVLEPITGNEVQCSGGMADIFDCENVNLLSFLPISEMGGSRGVQINDIWGWTDPKTDKEYALIGRMDGTSVVDVSNPGQPVYIGNLSKTDGSNASIWRDIKVYENHAFIVADNAGNHGMQVLDLTKVREFDGEPIIFNEVTKYDNIHSAHNVVINKDSGFAYIVGSSGGGETCGGGLHMVNLQDPKNPTFAGCFADPSTGRSGTGYTHDAQCVMYHGPDQDYKGREICVGSNETAISIADVTDKENPKAISTASYPDHAYVHQGWFTEDQRYFFQNDELDELNGNVKQTRTLIWDLADLDDPRFVRNYMLDNQASDHNLYIKGDTMFESNYVSGIHIFDVSDPENPVKKGSFDTEPFGEDKPGFAGSWSNYPFFDSGIIIMTSMQEGLFILKEQMQEL